MSTTGDTDVQEQPEQPTPGPCGAGRSRGHFESSSTKIRPQNPWKRSFDRKTDFCVKKSPKSKSGKISSNSTKSRPKPITVRGEEPKQHQLPEEVEPKSQQSQEVILITQPEVTATRFPKVPTVEVIRGQQSAQTHHLPEETVTQGPSRSGGHPRLDSNSFFGDNFAQEARRRKRSVIRDARPTGQPQP